LSRTPFIADTIGADAVATESDEKQETVVEEVDQKQQCNCSVCVDMKTIMDDYEMWQTPLPPPMELYVQGELGGDNLV